MSMLIQLVGIYSAGTPAPLVSLTDMTLSVIDTGVQTYGFRLNRDGSWDEQETGVYASHGGTAEWIGSAYRSSDIGDSYEFKTVIDSGDALSNVVDDTWADIGPTAIDAETDCSFVLKTYEGTLFVREKADPDNIATCHLSFEGQRL